MSDCTWRNNGLGPLSFELDLTPYFDSLRVPRKKCEEGKEEVDESDQGLPDWIQVSS